MNFIDKKSKILIAQLLSIDTSWKAFIRKFSRVQCQELFFDFGRRRHFVFDIDPRALEIVDDFVDVSSFRFREIPVQVQQAKTGWNDEEEDEGIGVDQVVERQCHEAEDQRHDLVEGERDRLAQRPVLQRDELGRDEPCDWASGHAKALP